ncbi:MAG: prephenate dehydratase [Burkholderiales bacterium]|nr:prephenate dehydratase [Burkholderiales bacterium]
MADPLPPAPPADAAPDDRIAGWRARIDAIDAQILGLFNSRAICAHEIGAVKGGAAVYRPEREAQVLARLQALNAGPLPAGAIAHLFTELISACRALERDLHVAYLGPAGTFSEEAARRQFGAAATGVPLATIADVFHAVEAGQAHYGVVPIENSTEGGVAQTMDRLASTTLRICGEVQLAIHHHLLAAAHAGGAAPRVVYAHAQALAQCAQWLGRELPAAERVPVASNAEAARRVASEPDAAAIASQAAAALYGLTVRASNIEDAADNTTRFLVIGDQDVAPSGRDRTSIVMGAPHRPGAMVHVLEPLARHEVSMTRLESRPVRIARWEYLFFVDLDGHQLDAPVAAALAEVRARAAFLKVLGSYPVAAR